MSVRTKKRPRQPTAPFGRQPANRRPAAGGAAGAAAGAASGAAAAAGVRVEEVAIDAISFDCQTQAREAMCESAIDEYASLISAGTDLGAVDLFWDEQDGSIYIGDGWHRLLAHLRAGKTRVRARVHRGGKIEAIEFSAGANHAHGLRRTNADKRRAVMQLLSLERWADRSDRQVAAQAGVHWDTVGRIRREMAERPLPQSDTPGSSEPTDVGERQSAPRRKNDPPNSQPARSAPPAATDQPLGAAGPAPEVEPSGQPAGRLQSVLPGLIDELAEHRQTLEESEYRSGKQLIADLDAIWEQLRQKQASKREDEQNR